MALYGLSQQAVFGWHGAEVQATITALGRNLVTLDIGADDRAHSISASMFHRWQVGQKVTVLCELDADGRRHCRMVSGLDRWLGGLVTLAAALLCLAAWQGRSGARGRN